MIDQRTKYDLQTTGRKRRKSKAQLHLERNARRHAEKVLKKAAQVVKPQTKPQTASSYPIAPEYQPRMGKEFYSTREWRNLRFDVIRASNGHCVYCGRSSKQYGIVIHIDHIKPRSKFPELELVKSNLQVTCEDCNIGKGAQVI